MMLKFESENMKIKADKYAYLIFVGMLRNLAIRDKYVRNSLEFMESTSDFSKLFKRLEVNI